MKKRKEGFLDFLYNMIDYVLVLVIILIIGVIVTWKLDLLLNSNVGAPSSASIIDRPFGGDPLPKEKEEKETPPSAEGETEPSTSSPDTSAEPPKAETPPADTNTEQPAAPPTAPVGEKEKVFIPDGISAYKIGEILVEKGFVKSAKEFNDRAVELKLDRRMQTGYFMIPKGASLDEVIKIVCKVKN